MANILGTQNNDVINGSVSDDTIYGLEGADSIIASTGNDVVDGDRIFQSNVAINIPFSTAIGSLLGFTINSSQVMTFVKDTLVGGIGNDVYVVNHGGVLDVINEQVNEGIDTVQSFSSYTLTNNVDNLTLLDDQTVRVTYSNLQVTMLGTLAPTELDTLYVSTAIQGTGNTLANSIIGNTKSNLLQGLEGDDTLTGGLGNDTLEGGTGTDTAVYMGNWSEYRITGTIANATVTGLEGTDSLSNIEYVRLNGVTVSLLDAMNDAPIAVSDENSIIEATPDNSVNSEVLGNVLDNDYDVDIYLGDSLVVNSITDGEIGSSVIGIYGSLVLNADGSYVYTLDNMNSNTDLLVAGQTANDIFYYQIRDIYGELSTAVLNITVHGEDDLAITQDDDLIYGDQDSTNYSDYIYALGGNDTVYGLSFDDTLEGDGGNDQLYGDSGNDILDGGTGIDTLVGGTGDDSYLVDDSADVITEISDEGHDAVVSTVTYTLSAHIEDLTLDGEANINATGNDLNNLLIGNNGNNILDGGIGADALLGGEGDDTYIVDSLLDGITENVDQGIDTVLASVNYTLGGNVENLTLQGAYNINATGNTLNNILTGNSGNNSLLGASGNDTLDGGLGTDVLNGGADGDVYYINDVGDTIIESNTGGGVDTVMSSLSYSLAGIHVENLSLTGTANLNGTGNTLNNTLTGNSGNNSLLGASGNDTLDGGLGTDVLNGGADGDVYYINDVGDTIIESNTGGGVDTVMSSLSYSLAGIHVENLSLTGTANLNGTGNTLNNTLTGNSGNNTLSGSTGNDTYVFGVGGGQDTIVDTSGTLDVLSVLAGVAQEQLWFKQVGNHLEVSIIGTTDKVTVNNWYVGGTANQLEEIRTATGDVLLASQVQNLVNAMSSFSAPPVGTTTLDSSTYASVLNVIAANWS